MKVEFTNFKYKLLPSTMKGYKEVCVSYTYQGRGIRKMIYIREEDKMSYSDYINEAKKRINEEIENGKLYKHSKKFGKGSVRTGKGLNRFLTAFGIVMAVGAVGLGGLAAYKFITSEGSGYKEGEKVDAKIHGEHYEQNVDYNKEAKVGEDYVTTITVNALKNKKEVYYLPESLNKVTSNKIEVTSKQYEYNILFDSVNPGREATLRIPAKYVRGPVDIYFDLTLDPPTPPKPTEITVGLDKETEMSGKVGFDGETSVKPLSGYSATIYPLNPSEYLDRNTFQVFMNKLPLDSGISWSTSTTRVNAYDLTIDPGIINAPITIHAEIQSSQGYTISVSEDYKDLIELEDHELPTEEAFKTNINVLKENKIVKSLSIAYKTQLTFGIEYTLGAAQLDEATGLYYHSFEISQEYITDSMIITNVELDDPPVQKEITVNISENALSNCELYDKNGQKINNGDKITVAEGDTSYEFKVKTVTYNYLAYVDMQCYKTVEWASLDDYRKLVGSEAFYEEENGRSFEDFVPLTLECSEFSEVNYVNVTSLKAFPLHTQSTHITVDCPADYTVKFMSKELSTTTTNTYSIPYDNISTEGVFQFTISPNKNNNGEQYIGENQVDISATEITHFSPRFYKTDNGDLNIWFDTWYLPNPNITIKVTPVPLPNACVMLDDASQGKLSLGESGSFYYDISDCIGYHEHKEIQIYSPDGADTQYSVAVVDGLIPDSTSVDGSTGYITITFSNQEIKENHRIIIHLNDIVDFPKIELDTYSTDLVSLINNSNEPRIGDVDINVNESSGEASFKVKLESSTPIDDLAFSICNYGYKLKSYTLLGEGYYTITFDVGANWSSHSMTLHVEKKEEPITQVSVTVDSLTECSISHTDIGPMKPGEGPYLITPNDEGKIIINCVVNDPSTEVFDLEKSFNTQPKLNFDFVPSTHDDYTQGQLIITPGDATVFSLSVTSVKAEEGITAPTSVSTVEGVAVYYDDGAKSYQLQTKAQSITYNTYTPIFSVAASSGKYVSEFKCQVTIDSGGKVLVSTTLVDTNKYMVNLNNIQNITSIIIQPTVVDEQPVGVSYVVGGSIESVIAENGDKVLDKGKATLPYSSYNYFVRSQSTKPTVTITDSKGESVGKIKITSSPTEKGLFIVNISITNLAADAIIITFTTAS